MRRRLRLAEALLERAHQVHHLDVGLELLAPRGRLVDRARRAPLREPLHGGAVRILGARRIERQLHPLDEAHREVRLARRRPERRVRLRRRLAHLVAVMQRVEHQLAAARAHDRRVALAGEDDRRHRDLPRSAQRRGEQLERARLLADRRERVRAVVPDRIDGARRREPEHGDAVRPLRRDLLQLLGLEVDDLLVADLDRARRVLPGDLVVTRPAEPLHLEPPVVLAVHEVGAHGLLAHDGLEANGDAHAPEAELADPDCATHTLAPCARRRESPGTPGGERAARPEGIGVLGPGDPAALAILAISADRPRRRPSRADAQLVGAPFALSPRLFALATLVYELPREAGLLYERKLDGYRALAEVRGDGRVRMISRNGRSFVEPFPEVAAALAATPGLRGCVVDGEIVAYDERGRVSFQAMQRARGGGASGLVLFLFDLLAEAGEDVRALPLSERKARLLARVPRDGAVRGLDATPDADRALAAARDLGDEGILAKRAADPYRAGRGTSWRKLKLLVQDDFVVVGRTRPTNPEDGLGSLVLATRERRGGPLVFAGRVGTGFDRSERRRLAARLARAAADEPPVEVPRGAGRGVRWSRPELVVRVAYLGLTDDGVLRHPTFRGERADLDARDVVRERTRS